MNRPSLPFLVVGLVVSFSNESHSSDQERDIDNLFDRNHVFTNINSDGSFEHRNFSNEKLEDKAEAREVQAKSSDRYRDPYGAWVYQGSFRSDDLKAQVVYHFPKKKDSREYENLIGMTTFSRSNGGSGVRLSMFSRKAPGSAVRDGELRECEGHKENGQVEFYECFKVTDNECKFIMGLYNDKSYDEIKKNLNSCNSLIESVQSINRKVFFHEPDPHFLNALADSELLEGRDKKAFTSKELMKKSLEKYEGSHMAFGNSLRTFSRAIDACERIEKYGTKINLRPKIPAGHFVKSEKSESQAPDTKKSGATN